MDKKELQKVSEQLIIKVKEDENNNYSINIDKRIFSLLQELVSKGAYENNKEKDYILNIFWNIEK